jgi:hypothetical protein
MAPFDGWENFYVIVGSSAGALTGLQFVVIALSAETRSVSSTAGEVNAFGTPTVVHFCAVLLLGATVSIPWNHLARASLALTSCGIAGLIYTAIVLRRTRRQTRYVPVLEDWVWHLILPFIAYAAIAGSGIGLAAFPDRALFTIGAAALILLFAGIHNAWDAVIFIASGRASVPDNRPGHE